jgi:polysaccharide export outer membrane protein
MHKIVKFFSLIALPLLFLSLPVQAAGLSDYRLGSGDRIKLQVYGEEEMTVETLLSDAGTISYPFLGELQILGMTVGQLEAKVISDGDGDKEEREEELNSSVAPGDIITVEQSFF